MKKILALLTTIIGLSTAVQAQVPVATYRWNFNQTNINSTNYIFPTLPNGTVSETPTTLQGMLRELDGVGASVNLLGLNGSGVSSGTFPNIPNDRGAVVPGLYGDPITARSYIIRTPDVSYALTNWPNDGIITNFTITCWAKSEGIQGAFPRIVMFGANGQDAGSAGANCFGLLFYNNGDLQLKVHNVSNPTGPSAGNGISTTGQPLAGAATNWAFIAVSYDSTIPTTGVESASTNTVFYFGTRNDSLLSPVLAPGSTILYRNYFGLSPANPGNNIAPAAVDGPGFVNFSATQLNGNGTPGVSNVFVAIANRYNGTGANSGGGNRTFNGRYDDIRLFANKVLTLAEVEAVRTNAPPGLAGPLTIVQQPVNTTVAEGQGASFTVVASEAPNRTYQWYKTPKGIGSVSNVIVGATSPTLDTTNLTVAGNNGDKYIVIVHSSDPLSDNGGQGAKSQFVVANVLSTSQYAVTPGMLKFEYYLADSGTSVGNFLTNPSANYTNSTPDMTFFLPTFDTRNVFPDDSHQNFFGEFSGWITPTVTTNYVFYLRASDQAELFLSTDDTTNNFGTRIAADNRNNGQVFLGPETVGTAVGTEYSSPIPLVAGNRYAVLAHLKTGLSQQDFLQVAWRTDSGAQDLPVNDANLADRLTPIPGSVLSSLALPLGTVSINQQPVATPSSTTTVNSRVTLTVGASATTNTGTGPLVIQWQQNGTNIAGATGSTYTTPYLTAADNGSQYRAIVSFPGVSTTSSPVTLTVTSDNVAPTVISALSDDSMRSVTVQFSEPVSAATALNPANYSIPGLTVLSAAFAVSTNLVDNPTYTSVLLTTTRQVENATYNVTVTGVQDTALQTITGGNTASFLSFGFAPGFAKFEYFESLYVPADDGTVNSMILSAPKFVNNDPDTVVYPRALEMSPFGINTLRSGGQGIGGYPPGFYGTRMSTFITPAVTTNYIFYLSADNTGILWLSTDDNPANKHAIAYGTLDASFAEPRQWSNANSAVDTNVLAASLVNVPEATFWPVVDGSNIPVITLTAGQRYYLEVDQRETAGNASVNTVTWDGGTGVAPANGTATVLTGGLIGWHFPQPQITSFAKVGNNFNVVWINSFGRVVMGVQPWPGVVTPTTAGITASFPSNALQSTLSLNSPIVWTTLTNTSPASIPATGPMQFFRVNEQ
jgi:hypothetical protein